MSTKIAERADATASDHILEESEIVERLQQVAAEYARFHARNSREGPAAGALSAWMQAAEMYRGFVGREPAADFAYALLVAAAQELNRAIDAAAVVARGGAMDAAAIDGRIVVRITCSHPETLEDAAFLVIDPAELFRDCDGLP